MQIEQLLWDEKSGWIPSTPAQLSRRAQIVFIFGSRSALARKECMAKLREAYPDAQLFGCSTAGEILGTRVRDNSLVVTAVAFDTTTVRSGRVNIGDHDDSREAGRELASQMRGAKLKHLFVLSDGIRVNGTELVSGLTENLPEDVVVTGGLSADGDRFEETRVIHDGLPRACHHRGGGALW